MYQGVNSDPNDHQDVVNSIKQLSNSCLRTDGSNPCTSGKYKKDATEMANDAIKSEESHFLGYSEVIGEVFGSDRRGATQKFRCGCQINCNPPTRRERNDTPIVYRCLGGKQEHVPG